MIQNAIGKRPPRPAYGCFCWIGHEIRCAICWIRSAGTRTRNQPRKTSGLFLKRATARLKLRAEDFFSFKTNSSLRASAIHAWEFLSHDKFDPVPQPMRCVIAAALVLCNPALKVIGGTDVMSARHAE